MHRRKNADDKTQTKKCPTKKCRTKNGYSHGITRAAICFLLQFEFELGLKGSRVCRDLVLDLVKELAIYCENWRMVMLC